jgi:hypothetical protein
LPLPGLLAKRGIAAHGGAGASRETIRRMIDIRSATIAAQPITLEMSTCGQPNAYWDLPAQKIVICYELGWISPCCFATSE